MLFGKGLLNCLLGEIEDFEIVFSPLTSFTNEQINHAFSLAKKTLPLQDEETV